MWEGRHLLFFTEMSTRRCRTRHQTLLNPSIYFPALQGAITHLRAKRQANAHMHGSSAYAENSFEHYKQWFCCLF
jgi:hypothetical protein